MKKQIFKLICTLALVSLMVFALASVTGAAEYYTDVYLKGGASGSGASASDPVGTWQDAYEALDLTKDCTIVICGPTTMTKMYNYGKPYTGSVTITNKFDGVDYRETAGACLNIGASAHFVCNGDTRFENIDLNATGGRWLLMANHNPLAMGEGINITGEGLTGGKIKTSIAIIGGYQNGINNPPLSDTKDVNITVLSGSKYYIVAFNREFEGTFTGTANIYIGGDAEVATLHCSSDKDNSVVGDVNITVTDNAHVNTFYGGTANVSVNNIKLTWLSGTFGDIVEWDCRYTPTKKLNITGETTLVVSEKIERRSNFSTIAAMFDNVEKYNDGADDKPQTPTVTKPDVKTDYGCAVGLYNLGLAQGYDSTGTNFGLTDKMTRIQTVVQVIRFLGKEAEVKAGNFTHPFTDVPAWANNYVGYAYANNITAGRSATKFDTDGVVDEMQFLTFMLRAIGYKDAEGDFVWNNPFALAKKIGMSDSDSAAATFVRGDAFRISWNALYATAKNGNAVYTNLINAGVFTNDSLDKAASAALSAVEPSASKPQTPTDTVTPTVPADPEGYNVISKSDYYDKTLAGFMSNIVGVLTGYEHVYKGGVPMVALPEEWYGGLLKGPYAEANENNKHADHLLYNEETKLWEVWTDDDYSIDILNQYVLRDSYAKYGVVTSDAIQNAWVGYNQWDMGGGHRSNGAYGLSAKLGYMPPFTGKAEFGNLYSTIGEPIIENETLGMDAAGMPNVAFDLTDMFSANVADSDATPWAKYLSAMYAMAYFEKDIPTMIRKAQSMLPADSYEYKLIDESFKLYEKYPTDWRKAVIEADNVLLREHYNRERMSENSINGPIMTLALLYANGGYEETCKIIGLAGHGGESAAASALGIIGVMQGWENLESNAKPIVNEFVFQDGKGVIVNLPLPDVKQIYWMHAEGLPARILITDIVKMYQANFEKILLENGGKIEGDNYYIPKYRIYESMSVCGEDFEKGNLGIFKAKGNAAISDSFYTGKYAAKVNGSDAAENSVYTTVSGLTVGAQYKVSAYINATTKTTAHLFAREVGAKNYPFVSVSDPSRYVLRTFVFTATAPTMEIGLSVPQGTSEFKYACLDDFVVVRAEERVDTATVTVMGNASANKYTGIVNVNIKGSVKASTGNDVYLKVKFANTAATTLDVPMTLNGETYATIPFYKTGADVYANASDATYIPIVLGENTAVSLDVGTTGLYIYSAEIVTTKDRW